MHVKSAAALTAATIFVSATACGLGDDSGGDGGTVTVGAIMSMSGIYSTLGPAQKNAMVMGVEALNEAGFMVDGKRYEMQVDYADDRSDAATAGLAELREMIEVREVPVVAFGLGADVYAEQMERTPLPMINILDSAYPSILDLDEHYFRTRSDSPSYVPGCVSFARDQLGVERLSVITASGETYGEGLTQLVTRSAQLEGVEIAATAEFPLDATDFGNAINEAVAADPDAVYLSSVTAVILPVLKQLRQSGYDGPVLHSSGVNPDQAEDILGADFNSIMEDNYDCAGALPDTSTNPATTTFARDYRIMYDEYPQDLTLWAYDFPFIVAEAMTEAGTTTDREAILAALHEIDIPLGTVSGWIADEEGHLFTDRMARTASEVTTWCPADQSLASAMIFRVRDGRVDSPIVMNDPCG
ncbi:ABC transporter substrate-binding protein [Streptomyces specialis]|uniref:ABC transporter substrate-binding protein n=1 Tax=Streptomyces specialis TaxID=498367 RepID=UPI00073FA795|nr:ABC transporter substrate-binding protein [Streptomyces specialis]